LANTPRQEPLAFAESEELEVFSDFTEFITRLAALFSDFTTEFDVLDELRSVFITRLGELHSDLTTGLMVLLSDFTGAAPAAKARANGLTASTRVLTREPVPPLPVADSTSLPIAAMLEE
jgi:hypothetical protein